jgi:quinol monooxygenase YgiN
MADVIVIATARAKPGKEKDLERALREVTQPTRQQPGCVRFSLYRSQEDPAVIVGVERWKSKEDHDRHLEAPYFQKLAAAMGGIIAAPPQIVWHEILDDN